ncbi:hypothetical protein [Ureibacillus sp. FSL K6-3587]|uniref:hypothetical protein n=1 Tax=Ureibacillus sp. FSL K6-3587 TaxID=2954681 RepID=UPI0031587F44
MKTCAKGLKNWKRKSMVCQIRMRLRTNKLPYAQSMLAQANQTPQGVLRFSQ